jgi:rod shape-determining protein MreC
VGAVTSTREAASWKLGALLDIRRRTGILFVVMVIGHVILISAQVQSKAGVPVLEQVTFGVFARVQQGTASVVHGVRDVWWNYADLRGVRGENERLRQQVAELEVRLQEQRALAARTEKLQQLLDLKPAIKAPTLPAQIIAGPVHPDMLTVTIDRGSDDGVQENMAVIASTGVVGRVVGPVASGAARVQLLIDHNAAAGALSERTRAGGVVVGREGDPALAMELVSNLADVVPGDVIVTSGTDGIYPKGFTIGTVESSDRGDGLYREIGVRPAAEFRGLEEVLVVLVPATPATPPAAAAPGGPPK